ncbi:hypothetical protein L2E82_44866 [Cichorium intybus]|uniref:Uncharacterized protein n=1 Tax=Cichorium intybus TaxID=13427 RepID=A0ACB8ZSA4_CICIN|nr:hypothetical protein L2E82_44866 [Cichorium intybus]
MLVGPSVFGTYQEVDQPQPSSSKMHPIDLTDTNSSSDKADTKAPQSIKSPVKYDALHQKVDALTNLLTDLKASQNQEALVKEVAALKERIAALEKRHYSTSRQLNRKSHRQWSCKN